MEYSERLKRLDLTTLEQRRKRGDLIQIYKMINGLEKIELVNGINFASSAFGLIGHNLKLRSELVKNCSSRYNFLTNFLTKNFSMKYEKKTEQPNFENFVEKEKRDIENKAKPSSSKNESIENKSRTKESNKKSVHHTKDSNLFNNDLKSKTNINTFTKIIDGPFNAYVDPDIINKLENIRHEFSYYGADELNELKNSLHSVNNVPLEDPNSLLGFLFGKNPYSNLVTLYFKSFDRYITYDWKKQKN